MTKHIKHTLIVLLLFCTTYVAAQDTLKQVFRPRIGMGTGVMTYYGEIQNYQKRLTPTVNRFGGLVYINAPISNMFNLEFSANYVKVAANERTLVRNYNFESRIRMGTAMLYYNFYPLFEENRSRFHPFLGIGISSFEFLSKTDLLDAAGNEYFYWSDGSIMSMDENNPLAQTDAVPLTRDYTYETDLRELDADNLGKYREQSLSFPLSMGVEWHMSPRWDFRIASTYNFTFTDLIDNLSTAGTGIREGDKKNDRLLFTYVSLSYDLEFGKRQEKSDELLGDPDVPLFAEWDPNDFDKDGVIDALDQCPATPLEALVDENGCPLDSDEDGVPDYRDDEPGTPLGSYVNEFGVTLSESDFEEHALLYYDSTGYAHDFEEYRTEIILNKEAKKTYPKLTKENSGLSYVIVLGKERKDVTVNDLHKFLSYSDYSSFTKGDTVYYTLGEYNTIEEAVAAKSGLESQGIDVSDIGRNSGNNETIFSIDEEVIEKVERINVQEGRESPTITKIEQIYRVQLGAFRNKINAEKTYPGIEVVYGASEKDNINRYYSKSFKTYDEAVAFQKELTERGFEKTFVVAYEQQSRVTLIEAGVEPDKLPEDYSESKELDTFVDDPRDEDTTTTPPDTITVDTTDTTPPDVIVDEDNKVYRIRLAYFADEIPVETVDILYNIKNIKPVKGPDGSTTYYSQAYDTKEARDAAMNSYLEYGLEEIEPMIEYEGAFYTDEEFKNKFGQ